VRAVCIMKGTEKKGEKKKNKKKKKADALWSMSINHLEATTVAMEVDATRSSRLAWKDCVASLLRTAIVEQRHGAGNRVGIATARIRQIVHGRESAGVQHPLTVGG